MLRLLKSEFQALLVNQGTRLFRVDFEYRRCVGNRQQSAHLEAVDIGMGKRPRIGLQHREQHLLQGGFARFGVCRNLAGCVSALDDDLLQTHGVRGALRCIGGR